MSPSLTLTDQNAFDVFSGTIGGLVGRDAGYCSAQQKISLMWGPPTATAHYNFKTRTVCIPWPGPHVDPAHYSALRGYALHELGHALWTDFVAWEKAIGQTKTKQADPIKVELVNIFEDARINDMCCRHFPPAPDAFQAVWRQLKARNLVCPPDRPLSPKQALMNDVLTLTARAEPGLLSTRSEPAVLQRLTGWLDRYLLPNPSACVSDVAHVGRLTDQFMHEFNDILNQTKTPEQPGQPQSKPGSKPDQSKKPNNPKPKKDQPNETPTESSEDDRDDGDSGSDGGSGDHEPSQVGDGADPEDGDGSADSDAGADPAGDGDGDSDASDSAGNGTTQGAEGESEAQESPSLYEQLQAGAGVANSDSLLDRFKQDIEPMQDTARAASSCGVLEDIDDDVLRRLTQDSPRSVVHETRKLGAKCASVVRQAFAAKAVTADLTDLDDGELDPDKLPEIARNIFDNPFMKPGRIVRSRETAVHVCLDGSESMCTIDGGQFKDRCVAAVKAVLADPNRPKGYALLRHVLATLFGAIGPTAFDTVSGQHRACMLSGFPNEQRVETMANGHPDTFATDLYILCRRLMPSVVQTSGAALALHDAMRGARVPHEISAFMKSRYVLLKSFGATLVSPTGQRILNSAVAADGTPAAEAWKRSIGSLLLRREQRRVLIVMTDGEVNDPNTALGVLNVARKMGIEVYGVGINSLAITNLFPKDSKAVTVCHGGIAQHLIELVRAILTKQGIK